MVADGSRWVEDWLIAVPSLNRRSKARARDVSDYTAHSLERRKEKVK
jgi:hypothetical protein